MKRFVGILLCALLSAGSASAQYDPNLLPHAATNAVLQTWPTAVYGAVVRDGQSAAGDVPALVFLPETGTCVANSKTSDGVTCLNTTAGDGNSWFATSLLKTANTWSATQTLSAASGAGGLKFNNSTRSSSWSVTPTNSNQEGGSTDLGFYSNTGNAFVGQTGFWAGFDGRLVVGHNTHGVVNSRQYAGVQAIGPFAGENNGFDAVAYDGWQQVALERFDTSAGAFVPVGSYEPIGVYCFTAYDGASTNCISGMNGFTTHTQVHGSNEGAGAYLFYTPNGSTGLLPGLTLSAGGLGGVSVGSTNVTIPSDVPTDLGNGTINAASDIATAGHFRSIGNHGAVSACGTSPSFAGGNDQAGNILAGSGGVTACTYTFAKTYGATPVCLAQVNTTIRAALISGSGTAVTFGFSADISGLNFSYICMGIG